MLGLKTQENNKFNMFWKLIQDTAKKENKIFFADCGEGRVFETETMEGEDMSGWLIPADKSDDFKKIWDKSIASVWENNRFDTFYKNAIWKNNNGNIAVVFE